jgi:DNA-binding MarR family transcriptional regulator
MTKKEAFINEVIALTGDAPEKVFTPDALDFWNGLQISGDSGRPQFTENGRLVLDYMQKEKETYNNLFKAKEIGEGLGISSRTASGAMRKLVTDGYVEKVGENPVVYSLTTLGTEVNLNEEEG